MDVGVEKLKEEVNKHIFKTSVVQNIQSNAGTLSLPFSRSGTKAAKYAAKSTRPLSVVCGLT